MPVAQALGSHVYFGRGTSTVKAVSYTEIGICTQLDVERAGMEPREIIGPKPGGGRLVRLDVIDNTDTRNFSAVIKQNGFLLYEMLFGTGVISANGTFTPGARTATLKGWLKIEKYNQDNTLIFSGEFFVHLRVQPISFGEGEVTYTVNGREIYSTLATFTLSNLS